MTRRALVYCAAAGLVASCRTGPPAPHVSLAAGDSVLRAAFNADSGKVRAILLASPT